MDGDYILLGICYYYHTIIMCRKEGSYKKRSIYVAQSFMTFKV